MLHHPPSSFIIHCSAEVQTGVIRPKSATKWLVWTAGIKLSRVALGEATSKMRSEPMRVKTARSTRVVVHGPIISESSVTKFSGGVVQTCPPRSAPDSPKKKDRKRLQEGSTVAEGEGGCEVTLTSAANLHLEVYIFIHFYILCAPTMTADHIWINCRSVQQLLVSAHQYY